MWNENEFDPYGIPCYGTWNNLACLPLLLKFRLLICHQSCGFVDSSTLPVTIAQYDIRVTTLNVVRKFLALLSMTANVLRINLTLPSTTAKVVHN